MKLFSDDAHPHQLYLSRLFNIASAHHQATHCLPSSFNKTSLSLSSYSLLLKLQSIIEIADFHSFNQFFANSCKLLILVIAFSILSKKPHVQLEQLLVV
jgi:hypothetical protein